MPAFGGGERGRRLPPPADAITIICERSCSEYIPYLTVCKSIIFFILRFTVLQERLCSLSIDNELAKSMDDSDAIDDLAPLKARKVSL